MVDLGKLVELSERRECVSCGKVFRSEAGGLSALQKIVEHLIEHQPSPEQWTVAYNRIQEQRKKRPKPVTDGLQRSWGSGVRTVS